MPLLGRISIASCHSVIPSGASASTAHSLFCLAFLLPFVWFATARNDIAPSRLYSILSSLISFPICVHARKVRRATFPALFAHSLSRLHCWHIASPPSLFIVSLQNTCCYSPCSMILFHTHLPIFSCCLRGLAPSVMLNLLHVCGLNAHALSLTCAALCLLCLVSTFVY